MKTFLCLIVVGLAACLPFNAVAADWPESPKSLWELLADFSNQQDYIKKYSPIAVSEMTRTGIPASIKLAQALLESSNGQSELATKANNHFGVKCGGNWSGPAHYIKDDDTDENGQIIESCFRKYKDPKESYFDHSAFLINGNRYNGLFQLEATDYKGWARGLKEAGYATNPQYANLLMDLIERLNLTEFDKPGAVASNTTKPRLPTRRKTPVGVSRVNDLRVVITRPGNTLADISAQQDVSIEKLRKYNEKLAVSPTTPLPEKTKVYLQCKRRSWRGKNKFHIVQSGETLYSIAQQYGLRVDKLQKRNRISSGRQPAKGARLYLRGRLSKDENLPTRATIAEDDKLKPTTVPPTTTTPPASTPQPSQPSSNTGSGSTKPTPGDADGDGFFDFEMTPGTNPAPTPNQTPSPNPTPNPNPNPGPGNGSTQPNNPNPAPSPAEPAGAQYHVVAPGETLYRISKTYATTVEKIQQLNGMTNNNISIGQRIRVK
jgi:LysM repeat protein